VLAWGRGRAPTTSSVTSGSTSPTNSTYKAPGSGTGPPTPAASWWPDNGGPGPQPHTCLKPLRILLSEKLEPHFFCGFPSFFQVEPSSPMFNTNKLILTLTAFACLISFPPGRNHPRSQCTTNKCAPPHWQEYYSSRSERGGACPRHTTFFTLMASLENCCGISQSSTPVYSGRTA